MAVAGRFVHEYAAAIRRWAEWAYDEVSAWPPDGPDPRERGRALLRDIIETFGDDEGGSST